MKNIILIVIILRFYLYQQRWKVRLQNERAPIIRYESRKGKRFDYPAELCVLTGRPRDMTEVQKRNLIRNSSIPIKDRIELVEHVIKNLNKKSKEDRNDSRHLKYKKELFTLKARQIVPTNILTQDSRSLKFY